MTGANVFNWTAQSASSTLNADAATSKSKAGTTEMASLFASMMNTNYSTNSNLEYTSENAKQGSDITVTEDAYNRYQYRDNSIREKSSPELSDKVQESSEELSEFEQKVVQMTAEELDVSEEEVLQAMEILGLTAFDLMEPQNLVTLTMELTGVTEPAELLGNEQFVNLMQELQTLGSELMDKLDLPMEQMDAFIAEMDVLKQPVKLEESEFAGILEQTQESTGISVEQAENQVDVKAQVAELPEEKEPTELPEKAEKTVTTQLEKVASEESEPEEQSFGQEPRKESGQNLMKNEQTVDGQMNVQEMGVQTAGETNTVDTSYMSVDTMDIIRQIVEKIQVSVSEGTASMEMQLNPEHLGKIYLQISAKEGAVNAQITAANEAVRDALQMQIADLKESLNQAGVKVDAIEVTVASHEFERNLEQDQKQREQEGERAQEQSSHRRNLNLSSLDELSGMMTEEETLVAQMMRDNGNSVDLSA